MPKLTDAEIKAKIAERAIGAMSVDTAVFDRYKCDLDHKVLARLDQLKKFGVVLLFSEVVISEVTAHIARDAAGTQRELRKLLKQHARRWKLDEKLADLKAELALESEAKVVAKTQVDRYLEAIGGGIVAGSGKGDLAAEVLRRYFDVVAPFEEKEGKKCEFPDAFALLSLEQAAVDRKTLLICVSPDKGWAAFGEHSKSLVVVPELDVALSWFHDIGRAAAEMVVAKWKAGTAPNLTSEIENAFEYALDGYSFDIEGEAPLDYEVELISAVLQGLSPDKIEAPIVVAEDDEQITFTVKAAAVIGLEAEFHFYSYDSVDGNSVSLGSQTPYHEEELLFELTITVARKSEGDELDVIDVKVTPRRMTVNFGYVDPFPDDDPTHEKY